jgi:hypothetical protein
MDAGSIIADLYPALNATTDTDLQWWTLAQLYDYLGDQLAAIARAVPIFADVQSGSTSTAENTFPGVAAIAAAWNSVALRPATVKELEALDPAWDSTTGTPARWTEDLGPGQIRLYPAPSGSGALKIVHHGSSTRPTSGSPTITAYPIVSEMLWYGTLELARAQTGETWMPDVAAQAAGQLALLLKVARTYWGSAR